VLWLVRSHLQYDKGEQVLGANAEGDVEETKSTKGGSSSASEEAPRKSEVKEKVSEKKEGKEAKTDKE